MEKRTGRCRICNKLRNKEDLKIMFVKGFRNKAVYVCKYPNPECEKRFISMGFNYQLESEEEHQRKRR